MAVLTLIARPRPSQNVENHGHRRVLRLSCVKLFQVTPTCADKPAGTIGQSTHMDHLTLNESPRITATVGGCASGLALLIAAAGSGTCTRDSTGHAAPTPRLRAGRRRAWRRLSALPSDGRRSSVALRKEHATARSRFPAGRGGATDAESHSSRILRRTGERQLAQKIE